MKIEIPEAAYRLAQVEIVGTAGLLTNNIAPWIAEELKAKQEGRILPKTKHSGEEYFEAAKHLISPGLCGVPAIAFKQAMIDASSLVSRDGKRMLASARTFSVRGSHGALCAILDASGSPCLPTMSEAVARNDSSGGLCVTTRPLFSDWHVVLWIEFDSGSITLQAIVALLDRAGRAIGVGSWTPAKNGVHGTFKVVKVAMVADEPKETRRRGKAA